MRTAWILVVALLLGLVVGCGGGSGGGGGGDVVGAEDVAPDTEAPVGADIVLPDFAIIVEGSQSLGATGQVLEFAARISGGQAAGAVTWAWTLPEGASWAEGDGSTQSVKVQFANPGQFLLECSATDEAGFVAGGGALVTVVDANLAQFQAIGDVDGSGTVTQADVELLEDHLALVARLDTQQFARADVTLDRLLTDEDLVLVKNALATGGQAPTWLSSVSLMGGEAVHLMHRVLLQHSFRFQVRFVRDEGAAALPQACLDRLPTGAVEAPVTIFRGAPGRASFLVPEWTYCLETFENAKLRLEMLGEGAPELVEEWSVALHPLPPASAEPGARVLAVWQKLEDALLIMEGVLDDYASAVGADKDERGALVGTFYAARQEYRQQHANFKAAFALLDDDARALYEQVALANGWDQVESQLDFELERLKRYEADPANRISFGASEAIITAICAFKNVAAIAEKVAGINDVISAVTSVGVFLQAIPVVGQAIAVLSALSNVVGIVTDLIGMLAEYIPEFGDNLEITASPSALTLGQTSNIKVELAIKILSGLCGKGAEKLVGKIMDSLNQKMTNKIVARIPLLASAYKAAKEDKDKLSWAPRKVVEGIEYVTGKILQLAGVEGLLNNLAGKICGLFENADPRLPLDPSFLKINCGSISKGTWTCTKACIGGWQITGSRDICGEEKKGEGGLSCKGNPPPDSSDDVPTDPDVTEGPVADTIITVVETPSGAETVTEVIPGEPPTSGPEGPQTPVVFGYSAMTSYRLEGDPIPLGTRFTVWVDFTLGEGTVNTAFLAIQDKAGYLKVSNVAIENWFDSNNKSAVFDLIIQESQSAWVGVWDILMSVAPADGEGHDPAHVGNWLEGSLNIVAP